MSETTVDLPDDLRVRLRREAEAKGTSESDLIVQGVALLLDKSDHRAHGLPLPVFTESTLTTAAEMDEAISDRIKERAERR